MLRGRFSNTWGLCILSIFSSIAPIGLWIKRCSSSLSRFDNCESEATASRIVVQGRSLMSLKRDSEKKPRRVKGKQEPWTIAKENWCGFN